MRSRLLPYLCLAVLCITLTLGLWPFHAPRNDIKWLKRTHGIAFGKNGTVLSSGALKIASSSVEKSSTIEIWAQPDRKNGFSTLLTLYDPENSLWFTMRQSGANIELRSKVQRSGKAMNARLFVNNAFDRALHQKQPVLIAITSGQFGIKVYVDGVISKAAPGFPVPFGAFAGRLIVGDSPSQPDSFRGEIRGLAIYKTELNSGEVIAHYHTWMENGWPAISDRERNTALYLFNEHAGRTVHNSAMACCDLYIPESYEVVDKAWLEPFWTEFAHERGYWSANLKNLIGFIPLGFCLCAYFRTVHAARKPVFPVILLGGLVSLTIEVLQGFLPTRDSGTTDLITNTIGTWLGMLCYTSAYPVLAKIFPSLRWLGAL